VIARAPSRRRAPWLLFLIFQALYALTSSGNAFRIPDEYSTYYQVEHLVDAGDLSVPQAVAAQRFYGKIGAGGRPYAPYGPLTAVLAVPYHLFGRAVAAAAGISRSTGDVWTFVVGGVTMLVTSTAAALAVAGFYEAAIALGAEETNAWTLSLLLGAATVLWPYGTSLFSEAWQAAAFIWAAVFLIRRRVAVAAALVVFAAMTKFTSLAFVPAFIAAVLAERDTSPRGRWMTAAALAGGTAVAVALRLAWNLHDFGDPLEFGYIWVEMVPRLPARVFWLNDLPRGLAILLFSPGKSLLLWAPALWLSITRFRHAPRSIQAGTATALGCGLIVFGMYIFPEGGYAHGPRQLVPIVPLLLLPAALGAAPSRRSIAACAAIGGTIALLAVSVSFLQDQALGANLTRTNYYERIDPPPGRAWNRYRFDYIPFKATLASGEWPSGPVGLGVDFFWLHLARAKDEIPAARAIPMWLIVALPAFWSAVLLLAIALAL